MKKLVVLSILSLVSIQQSVASSGRPPILGAVMAAGEAVVDIPAGFFGTSTHKDQNRLPVLGVVQAAAMDAADIVVGVAGTSVYEDRRGDNTVDKKQAKKEKKAAKKKQKNAAKKTKQKNQETMQPQIVTENIQQVTVEKVPMHQEIEAPSNQTGTAS